MEEGINEVGAGFAAEAGIGIEEDGPGAVVVAADEECGGSGESSGMPEVECSAVARFSELPAGTVPGVV